MHPKMTGAMCEWAAALLIGTAPLLCHLVIAAWVEQSDQPGAWTLDLLMAAVTTSGISGVALFTRLVKGTLTAVHIRPQAMLLVAVNMVTFLLAGMLFGLVSVRRDLGGGAGVPLLLLTAASLASCYFEVLVVRELIAGEMARETSRST